MWNKNLGKEGNFTVTEEKLEGLTMQDQMSATDFMFSFV